MEASLRVSWQMRKTNEWVREKVGVTKDGLLGEIKKKKIRKYYHWKRRGESLVLAAVEGEIGGRGRRGRRKAEWIDNVRQWEGGMQSAQRTNVQEAQNSFQLTNYSNGISTFIT